MIEFVTLPAAVLGYIVGLITFAASVGRGAPASSKVILAWLALWPLALLGYILYESGHTRSLVPWRSTIGLVSVGLSLVLSVILICRSGRALMALFASVSVLPMAVCAYALSK